MNVLAALVLGLLIGWLAEWVIDWVYWRNRIRPVAEENANLKDQIKILEARKNKRSQLSKTKPTRDRAGKDNLQAIKGIGPVIAKRLNAAGVYTFEELAQLTPDELEEILGALIKRFFPGEDGMIEQAREFARQKAGQT
jgi:predicted flap endonuclease-1-like 5' DNA nuclease